MKMIKPILQLCVCMLLVISCKSLSISQETQTTTEQKVSLGTIGLDKDFILQSGFNGAAVPTYSKPIKVSALVKPFTKHTYKSFLKAKVSQTSNVDITYVDSIDVKPQFIQLKIADKVTLISALNEKTNKDVKDYLSHNTSANIVTHISAAFNSKNLEAIQQADAVFLVETETKTYALQLHKTNVKTQVIQFNEGVVFAYKTSNCCWQENKKRQLNIVDFVSEYNNCPNKTYRSANRAKKKINYYKL